MMALVIDKVGTPSVRTQTSTARRGTGIGPAVAVVVGSAPCESNGEWVRPLTGWVEPDRGRVEPQASASGTLLRSIHPGSYRIERSENLCEICRI
jgi:hypothetical protein